MLLKTWGDIKTQNKRLKEDIESQTFEILVSYPSKLTIPRK